MASAILSLQQIRDFPGKYPKQLWFLFLSEMWERFCFYGMRGVLTVFMVEQLFMDDKAANLRYGAIQAFVYAMTFIGGLLADKILGFRKSIFWGGLLMIVGSFTIAFAPQSLFYIGTSISIVGTGFFKPNISGVVGLLYHDGDARRDAGFALFYSGINVGAFFGGLLCFYVGDTHGWHWAFILSGLAMMIGLIVFALSKNTLGPLGFSPLLHKMPTAVGPSAGKDINSTLPGAADVLDEIPVDMHRSEMQHLSTEKTTTASQARMYEIIVYVASIIAIPAIFILIKKTEYTDIFMYIVGPCALLYLIVEMTRCTADEVKKLLAALVFIFFSICFWAFFEQSGGSLAIFARTNLEPALLGPVTIDPNAVNNSANSLFVILFSPLIGLLWLWLHKKGWEPNTVTKFGLGFLFLGLAFYAFYYNRFFVAANGISSLGVFTIAYLIITVGELCLSPIGLSIMTKLSPKRLFGVIMGMWFLASAYGQYVAGLLGAGMSSPDPNASALEKLMAYTEGYKQLAIYAVICGVILIMIAPLVRRLMGEVK